MADHLVLVGMMGSGKSTTARRVARRLGLPHLDTDDEVQRAAGESIASIFTGRGERWFRAEESRVLREAMASDVTHVVSVGGGAVLDAENRLALRGAGSVVWLRARPETLARRLPAGGTRPLLTNGGEEPAVALARIDAERRALYEAVATAVIDVDALRPDEVADRIVLQAPSPQTGERR